METEDSGWNVSCLKALLVLNLLDAVFTYIWVSLGLAEEANPLMEFVISFSPTAFILYKVLVVNLCVWLLWRTRAQMLCKVLCIPLTCIYVGILLLHLSFLTEIAYEYLQRWVII
jgi:uncharacterized membrane protein YpjA